MATHTATKKLALIAIVATVSLVTVDILGHAYVSPETTVSVVDELGKPLVGVLVVLNWKVAQPNDATIRQAHVFEGVTDKTGAVKIAAWGPIIVSDGDIPKDQPRIRLFKAGYVPIVEDNSMSVGTSLPLQSTIRLRWKDPITLRPAGSMEEYIHGLRDLVSSMDFYSRDKTCSVNQQLVLPAALNAEIDRVLPNDPVGIRVGLPRPECLEKYLSQNVPDDVSVG